MERTAVCSCGQLAVTVEGDPAFHGICSCFECQKMSGSAYSYSGYWPRSAVKAMRGESKAWRRVAESGRWLDQHFCPTCGSPVFGYVEFDPDLINISIGSLADPHFPPPVYAVWNRCKHPWVDVPRGCRSYDTQPADDEAP